MPIYPAPQRFRDEAHINEARYEEMYERSVRDPDGFWSEQATAFLTWNSPFSEVCSHDFVHGHVRWFDGGTLNACTNCVDRHLPERADQVAIIWEGDDPDTQQAITYRELADEVCRLANALASRGVKKGDRVCIYMPMIPEAAYAMLACARIGASSLRGLRRLFTASAQGPDPRFGLPGADHRGRGFARRARRPAQAERRDRPGRLSGRAYRPDGPTNRRRRALARGTGRLVPRTRGQPAQ